MCGLHFNVQLTWPLSFKTATSQLVTRMLVGFCWMAETKRPVSARVSTPQWTTCNNQYRINTLLVKLLQKIFLHLLNNLRSIRHFIISSQCICVSQTKYIYGDLRRYKSLFYFYQTQPASPPHSGQPVYCDQLIKLKLLQQIFL